MHILTAFAKRRKGVLGHGYGRCSLWRASKEPTWNRVYLLTMCLVSDGLEVVFKTFKLGELFADGEDDDATNNFSISRPNCLNNWIPFIEMLLLRLCFVGSLPWNPHLRCYWEPWVPQINYPWRCGCWRLCLSRSTALMLSPIHKLWRLATVWWKAGQRLWASWRAWPVRRWLWMKWHWEPCWTLKVAPRWQEVYGRDLCLWFLWRKMP